MMNRTLLSVVALLAAVPAVAQTRVDRVDPARIERENLPVTRPEAKAAPTVERPAVAPPAAATPASIAVGAVAIEGLQELSPEDFADIIARYVGRSLSGAELATLTEEIGRRGRERGYVFASASIVPQRLTAGVLVVRYDPGALDEIQLEGAESAAVRAALAPLLGRPARLDQVERRLLLAGDIDGIYVRRSRYVREGNRGILLVSILETRRRVRAVLENDSTGPIGPNQLRLDADWNRVLFADDSISLTHVSTPFEPEELQYVRARYAKRLNASGTEVTVSGSFSATHPGAYLEPLDLAGRSWFGSVAVLQPLQRRRDGSLWFSGGLDLRDTVQDRAGLRRRHDRLFALRLILSGSRKAGGGALRGNATLSRGLDGLSATRHGDPLASRGDADPTFTSLVVWGDWTRPLPDDLSIRLSAQGQLASRPLLIAEEIGIGGNAFLRGYDYSERSGDQGVMGSAELRYDWRNPLGLGRKAQLYGFADAGRVTNLRRGSGGGSLASAGAGICADVSSSIDASIEVAVPLSGPRYETDDRRPRINVRLLKLF
ncbi:Hemolysin activation/secretion protein [Sphingomonas guangdongensis]|uniref:Hemolysin activation/secretion protein n=1 Tax=Sphingomonas guangdongensis TaxID=1141890 RepID=A0A285R724_9SPHN|nr:ShlB/FhaC/HecB family hemolysin secretion/activation protein [Sphingomonas guangdongensis]SOB88182.1 Hemolysin activation/secretion protein [Sphingomonas guangdongensis]